MNDLQHPEFLALRPWLIVLALLHMALFLQQWWWQRRQFEAASAARFGPSLSLLRGLLKLGLWTMAGWYLLLALAVPLGPPTKVESQQSGADVIFAVDVSSSMLAQDIQPDRLTALKQALGALLGRLDGDRVGLIAFAGEAVVACPLTSDFDTVQLFLDKLDVDSVPRDGTGLGPALQMALDSFSDKTDRGKLVVLATDGEDTAASKVLEQAQRAKGMGIPVFTIGLGTPGGALIPGRRDVFGRVYAKTWQGQPVRTKLDSGTLKQIASITGGAYSEAGDQRGLAQAADRVRGLKQGLAKAQDRYVREPLYEEPLLIAFLLLLLDSLLSARGGGWRHWAPALGRAFRRWWHPKAKGKAALLPLLLLPLAVQAAPRKDYNAGNQAYRNGEYDQAAEAYERSLGQGADLDQASALYNLGNARFQLNDYDAAISAYQQALKLDPSDEDAQHNLELAEKRKQEQEQGKQGKDGKDGKKDGKKGGQKDGQGQPQPGQGQSGKQGQGQGKPQPGAGNTGQGQPSQAANALNQDRVQAMMNQLRLDQKRYSGAFNPIKKYDRADKPKDPMEQMMEEMGMRPKQPQQQQGGGPESKDW